MILVRKETITAILTISLYNLKLNKSLYQSKQKNTKYKRDTQLINVKGKINKPQENLQSNLQEIEEERDIHHYWQNLKQVKVEAAREFKLSKDVKNANCWWEGECERAIKGKIGARRKCVIRETRTNLDIHHKEKNKTK